MNHRLLFLCLGLLLALATRVEAQPINGRVDKVGDRTEKVFGKLQWHRSLDKALADARTQNKPLLWLQLVGDLDGGL